MQKIQIVEDENTIKKYGNVKEWTYNRGDLIIASLNEKMKEKKFQEV